MSPIMVGRFQLQDEVASAVEALATPTRAKSARLECAWPRRRSDIERCTGRLVAGDWADFNPLTPQRYIDPSQDAPA